MQERSFMPVSGDGLHPGNLVLIGRLLCSVVGLHGWGYSPERQQPVYVSIGEPPNTDMPNVLVVEFHGLNSAKVIYQVECFGREFE